MLLDSGIWSDDITYQKHLVSVIALLLLLFLLLLLHSDLQRAFVFSCQVKEIADFILSNKREFYLSPEIVCNAIHISIAVVIIFQFS